MKIEVTFYFETNSLPPETAKNVVNDWIDATVNRFDVQEISRNISLEDWKVEVSK